MKPTLLEKDIPMFTKSGNYEVDIPLGYFLDAYYKYINEYKLDINPDFQRAHVWDTNRQIKFVEFLLRGGQSSRVIYFNCPSWGTFDTDEPMVIVDGKQRLETIRLFMEGEIPAFGYFIKDIDKSCYKISRSIKFNINNLKTRKEVLQWYLDLNEGGIAHTSEEIQKVYDLLKAEE